MGKTVTEKILSHHSGKKDISPGDFIYAKVSAVLANDITAPISIREFEASGAKKVFDPDKVFLVPDHFTPNKDIKSAEQCKMLAEFAEKYGLTHRFKVGNSGVEHALLPEEGLVLPGDLVIGADSHTCTYGALTAFSTGVGSTDVAFAMITGKIWLKVPESVKFIFKGSLNKWVSGKDLILHTIGDIGVEGALYRSMEFTGPVMAALPMSDRFTMCNMAIEAGAKNGIVAYDSGTQEYIKGRSAREHLVFASDPDAVYSEVIEYDCTKIEPLVAWPHLPENVKTARESGSVHIDQVIIGSCTNGRIEDLRIAAGILKGRKVSKNVRAIIIPATQKIYRQALSEGLLEIFVDAEAAVSTPTCGPCLGGHMGILAGGEKAIATTNRNFVGRMGDPKSEVYLASPAVAAASAILGKIAGPDQL